MNTLDKYKPKLPSVFDQFEPDKQLSESDYAFDIYKKLLYAKRSQEFLFLAIGKMLKEIRDKKLYKFLDYETLGDFLGSEEIAYSRESAFMYIRVYEYYVEYLEMDEESVGTINISRLSLMIPQLKKIEDKTEVIKKIGELNALRHKDFVLKVRQESNNDRPIVFFSHELDRYIVEYYSDRTEIHDLGVFKEYQER